MILPQRSKRLRACLLVLPLLSALSTKSHAVEFAKKDFQLFGYNTQEHLWLSAGGTFIGSQIFQYWGLERTPASLSSAALIFGAGMTKEFVIDSQPGVNDIIADGIGITIGSIANFTIRFDYGGKSPTLSRQFFPNPSSVQNR